MNYVENLLEKEQFDEKYSIPDLNDPIYPGVSMTVGLLTSIFICRANNEHWPQETLKYNLMTQFSGVPKLLKKQYVFPKDLSQFKTFFKFFSNKTRRHYFCRDCSCLLKDSNFCKKCNNSSSEFIVEVDFRYSLNCSFHNKNFKQEMQYRYKRLEPENPDSKINVEDENSIEDIHDASRYLKIDAKYSKFFSKPENWVNIPYCIAFDGGSVFKMSEKSIWPVVLINYGLKPSLRYKHDNIILLGYFIGKQPDMKIFLQPFVEILEKWFQEGIFLLLEGFYRIFSFFFDSFLIIFSFSKKKQFYPKGLCYLLMVT